MTFYVLGFLFLLYIPFAGNYGLWDPWETHYGEVARQMVERGDWISLWWPGSPQDQATFWSKPVLTFWLMALSMKLFGLGHAGAQHAAEMTTRWTAEWALRLPYVLLGICGCWAVFHLVRRLCGKGAALWSTLLLATFPQWALITRQAMTDMAFVTPMTVATVFAALALLLPKEEVQAELPRRELRLGRLRLSWPHDRAFYLFLLLFVVCAVPQLIVDCVQLESWTFVLLGHHYRTAGVVPMLPWVALLLVALLWVTAGRDRRSIYLWTAYLLGGVANLAKGPAGIAIPVLTIGVFLLASGRWQDLLGRRRERPYFFKSLLPRRLQGLADHEGGLEVMRGTLVFLCVGAPWYAAMLIRHGMPFWMEFIGDNYVRRAQGRHGDRGTFDYYLRQLGAGMFPWTGVVSGAVLATGRWLRERADSPRRQLVLLCLAWFLVDFMIVSLVNTKFHHYILPALPALAILGGLLLDEVTRGETARDGVLGMLLVGLPITWLSGRDLANLPARIGFLFNYDYVNAPGGGRPWPLTSVYGQRYEYGGAIMVFSVAALVLSLALGLWAWRRARDESAPAAEQAPGAPGARGPGGLAGAFALLLLLLAAGIAVSPSPETVATWSSSKLALDARWPLRLQLGYLVPAAAAGLWLLLIWARERAALWQGLRRGVVALGLLVGLLSITWSCWVLDRFLVDISPHWSQKHVFATYYKLRKGPEEPVVAWYMYWRGENFYTRNQIYDHRLDAAEKTVFLGDHHAEKLQAYVNAHRGRRIFFLLERHRLETLRGLLPAESRPSLQIVDDSNNKVYMAVAQL